MGPWPSTVSRAACAGVLALVGALALQADAQSLTGAARAADEQRRSADGRSQSYSIGSDDFRDPLLTPALFDQYVTTREAVGRVFAVDPVMFERVSNRVSRLTRIRKAADVFAAESAVKLAIEATGMTPETFVILVYTVNRARDIELKTARTDARLANLTFVRMRDFEALERRFVVNNAWPFPVLSTSSPY